MTGRERCVAVARGGEVDRAPLVSDRAPADCLVVGAGEVGTTLNEHPESAVVAKVVSPLGRDPGLVSALSEDPSAGAARLAKVVTEVRCEIAAALDSGADGVLYVLEGACPSATTPMEYGGHFLEVDRSVLSEVAAARFNVLYVAGASEPYLDFVSDLPAHVFAWDPASGMPVEEVRKMRSGALACGEAGDVALRVESRQEARAQ